MAAIVAPPGAMAARLIERARAFAEGARSKNTRRAYASDWRRFVRWANAYGLPTLPSDPGVAALHAAWLADGGDRGRPYKVRTIKRALAAIGVVQRANGHPWPYAPEVLTETMRGIARQLGTSRRQATALEIEMLAEVFRAHRDDLTGLRDRAVVALQFFMAGRRSEVADVQIERLQFVPEGLKVTLGVTKTNQTGADQPPLGIPFAKNPAICAVRLVRAWIDASARTSGPLFVRVFKGGKKLGDKALNPGTVAKIVKKMVERAGYDPRTFSGTRSGVGSSPPRASVGSRSRASSDRAAT